MPGGICLKVMRMPPAVCLESIPCADQPLMPALRELLLEYQRLLLDTLPMMHAAQGLYASLGFKDTAAYMHNPVQGVRCLALSLFAAL
jgi:hypothetical protein